MCLPESAQGGPTQEVMTHYYQKHYRSELGHPAYGEPGHPVLVHLGIGPFGGGASLPVHSLGFLRGHALAPLHHLGTIAVTGSEGRRCRSVCQISAQVFASAM